MQPRAGKGAGGSGSGSGSGIGGAHAARLTFPSAGHGHSATLFAPGPSTSFGLGLGLGGAGLGGLGAWGVGHPRPVADGCGPLSSSPTPQLSLALLKPFDPALCKPPQFELRSMEAHIRITLAAIDKARHRFILQFSSLFCIAVCCLLHVVYVALTTQSPSDAADAAMASSASAFVASVTETVAGAGANSSQEVDEVALAAAAAAAAAAASAAAAAASAAATAAAAASSLSTLVLLGCVVVLLLYVATGTFVDRLQARPRYVQSCNRWLSLFGVQWMSKGPAEEASRDATTPNGAPTRPVRHSEGSSILRLALDSWRAALARQPLASEGLVIEELPIEPSPEPRPTRRTLRSRSLSPAAPQDSALTPVSPDTAPVFGNTLQLPTSISPSSLPGGAGGAAAAAASTAVPSVPSPRGGSGGEVSLVLSSLPEGIEPAASDSSTTGAAGASLPAPVAVVSAASGVSPRSPVPATFPPPPLDVDAQSTLSPASSSPSLVALTAAASSTATTPTPAAAATVASAESAATKLSPSVRAQHPPSPAHEDQLPPQSSGVRMARSHSNPVLAVAQLVRAAGSMLGGTPTRLSRHLGGSPRFFADGRPPLPSPDARRAGALPAAASSPSLATRVLTPTDARFLHSSIFSPDMSPEEDALLLARSRAGLLDAARPRSSAPSPRSLSAQGRRPRSGSDVSLSARSSPRAGTGSRGGGGGAGGEATPPRWLGSTTPMETEALVGLPPEGAPGDEEVAVEELPPPRDERERMLQQIARQAAAQLAVERAAQLEAEAEAAAADSPESNMLGGETSAVDVEAPGASSSDWPSAAETTAPQATDATATSGENEAGDAKEQEGTAGSDALSTVAPTTSAAVAVAAAAAAASDPAVEPSSAESTSAASSAEPAAQED